MPSAFTHATQNLTAQTITGTTETLILVSDVLSAVGAGGEGTLIFGSINITPGASTTAVVVRVRVGNTTGGTIVGAAQTITVTASVPTTIPVFILDPTNTTPENTQYAITVQQTGATGNGTVNAVAALVEDVTSAS